MLDRFGRKIDYLRVSVTDRCNLRCIYCLPAEGINLKSHHDMLSYEELERVIGLFTKFGVRRIRITGGEPLVRRGIVSFVAKVVAMPGVEDVSMTTNGILLESAAPELWAAGLKRLNISLDTLKPERFRQITRLGDWDDVMRGIEKVLALGFSPVKLNVVLLRGLNDDELADFARWTKEVPLHIRFIELMPLGEGHLWSAERFLSAREARARLESEFPLVKAEAVYGGGPARYYRIPGAKGTIGFITAMSEHFCQFCNRVRLTADGKINPCLASPLEVDLATPLRNGASDQELQELIRMAILIKPEEHHLETDDQVVLRQMSKIGG